LPTPNLVAFVAGARSTYLEQVRQIAPPVLIRREAELARLAEFCTTSDEVTNRRYLWWRAPAWTGKSALLSSFVLDPPPEIRVVSFFVTARYVGNSDRAAFVEIVTEQLAELLGESVPPFQDPGRRERQWFRFFADAAAHCEARGLRLILVVDGLDEDRGVIGPGARSIAGLLPTNPPCGARVVVAGRPNPPIPSDVPAGHPLRDPAIILALDRSNHATTIRADMQADLERLRNGSLLERDLLGLVTAAGGGLSGRDLQELSTDPDVTEWDIDQLLSTVAGRSFASRAPRWNDRPRVYLLGHEELQQDAIRAYGPRRLVCYRDRLHTWADAYRQQLWPPYTPEYLLRGYYRLLLATGDLARAVAHATDLARHDRMLDLTGGDAGALAEITDAQNAILAGTAPDLSAMARLAVHRQRINDRNSHIPTRLPAVWARLGHATRGEQLARSITDSDCQSRALANVAGALAQADQHARAERIARGIVNPDHQADALAKVAAALAQAGKHTHAAQIATDAEQVAYAITNADRQAWALADVAAALAQAGKHAHAAQIATDAEQVARTIVNPQIQAWVLTDVAGALAQAGERTQAAQVVRTIIGSDYQAQALVDVASALVQVGEYTHAEQIARTITSPRYLVF